MCSLRKCAFRLISSVVLHFSADDLLCLFFSHVLSPCPCYNDFMPLLRAASWLKQWCIVNFGIAIYSLHPVLVLHGDNVGGKSGHGDYAMSPKRKAVTQKDLHVRITKNILMKVVVLKRLYENLVTMFRSCLPLRRWKWYSCKSTFTNANQKQSYGRFKIRSFLYQNLSLYLSVLTFCF